MGKKSKKTEEPTLEVAGADVAVKDKSKKKKRKTEEAASEPEIAVTAVESKKAKKVKKDKKKKEEKIEKVISQPEPETDKKKKKKKKNKDKSESEEAAPEVVESEPSPEKKKKKKKDKKRKQPEEAEEAPPATEPQEKTEKPAAKKAKISKNSTPKPPNNNNNNNDANVDGAVSDGGYNSEGKRQGTAANAFQRVKADEWLGKKGSWDNSYVGTFGENGWGFKAEMVLGKVRGKDFRHEKTKKKRGSYKGGLIDTGAVCSYKFDSDDE